MAESYKICPRCKAPAPRAATECELCGKAFGKAFWLLRRAKAPEPELYDVFTAPPPEEVYESRPFPAFGLLLLLLLVPLALLAARAGSLATGLQATILFIVIAVALLVGTTPAAQAWMEKRRKK